jgi:predicted nucleotidyltransferase
LNTQFHLDKIVTLFKKELKENLKGIYLHGSLAMGCFNPNKSDIDLLVVVRENLTTKNKKRMAKMALSLHDELPNERGIEFSIILETYLKTFVHPTPFEFHYSDFHRQQYQIDEDYLCGGFEDEDLASQITVAYYRGISLYGSPLRELYEPIDRQYYLESILYDVKGASNEILNNPMYLTLNLCRVLFFLKEGEVSSKKEGGEWGVKVLPSVYQGLVQKCVDEYTDVVEKSELDNRQLLDFANYMLREIKESI